MLSTDGRQSLPRPESILLAFKEDALLDGFWTTPKSKKDCGTGGPSNSRKAGREPAVFDQIGFERKIASKLVGEPNYV
jgi:hypothetical protein